MLIKVFALTLCGLTVAGGACAQDLATGRDLARSCTNCHGALGLAVVPNAPNLAGESKSYLIAQLEAYQSQQRKHDQMTFIASGLSDENIEDLAAWFAAIKVTAEAPDLE